MSEIILSLFKEHKVLSIEDLKEKLNIESAKDFVELIKHVEKLEQKSTIVQLPNEKFLYVKEQLGLEGIIRLHQKGFAFVYVESLGIEEKFVKGVKAAEILKIKDVNYNDLKAFLNLNDYEDFVKNQIETMIKYEIFIERENKQIEKFKKLEHMYIDKNINYDDIKGISNIARAGLNEVRPLSIGEATRISGVTSNDITLIIAHMNDK